jgi:hypothetical protein
LGSTATPKRTASSSTHQRYTSADRASTTSSHVAHLDRNELGAILVTAGVSSARDHALVSLLALNGLRVSEAIGAGIGARGLENGHRTLTVLRKGGKLATVPLAPRVARAIDLAVSERLDGPIFTDASGPSSTGTPPDGSCAVSLDTQGSPSASGRTPFVTPSSPPRSTPAFHSVTYKKQPVTPTHAPRCATTAPASPATDTPPTSSPPSSPAPPANETRLA